METNLNNYMDNGDYLPDFLKDFHDQKDFFKSIYAQFKEGNQGQLLKDVNWIDSHIFTIDIFLWWMGTHGYKLQRSRKKGMEFYDPMETIEYWSGVEKERSMEILNKILK